MIVIIEPLVVQATYSTPSIGVSPEMTLHVESKVNCLIEGSEPVGDRVGKIMMIFPGFGMVFVGVNLIV